MGSLKKGILHGYTNLNYFFAVLMPAVCLSKDKVFKIKIYNWLNQYKVNYT